MRLCNSRLPEEHFVSGIYPAVWPGRKYDPAGLGASPWPAGGLETHGSGGSLSDDSRMTPTAGQIQDKAQGPEGRLTFMMGRLKKKGMTNISFTRKQDPDL